MRPLILEALGLSGLTGDEKTRANAMADALLFQLEDAEELRAFITDVTPGKRVPGTVNGRLALRTLAPAIVFLRFFTL